MKILKFLILLMVTMCMASTAKAQFGHSNEVFYYVEDSSHPIKSETSIYCICFNGTSMGLQYRTRNRIINGSETLPDIQELQESRDTYSYDPGKSTQDRTAYTNISTHWRTGEYEATCTFFFATDKSECVRTYVRNDGSTFNSHAIRMSAADIKSSSSVTHGNSGLMPMNGYITPQSGYNNGGSVGGSTNHQSRDLNQEKRDVLNRTYGERCRACNGSGKCHACNGTRVAHSFGNTYECKVCRNGVCNVCNGTGKTSWNR